MTNTEEAAAWAAVPELAQAETQLRQMEARAAALGSVDGPDDARNRVFADALADVRAGKPYPGDVGKRASKAWLKALEDESEALGIRSVVAALKALRDELRLSNVETALEALRTSFDAFMAEVRSTVADLDGAQSGEEAVLKSDKAARAWRLLTSMVGHLRAIRAAQFNLLRLDGDGPGVLRLQRAGYFEVRGIDLADVPADRLNALTSGAYDVPFLGFLAAQPNAWVPTSFDELRAESATPEWGVPDAAESLTLRSTELPPAPQPAPPVLTGFERPWKG